MLVEIYIGTDKLELFEDESISMTSSVLDVQDISKNTTDYTKSFTVPASDINNKIFKHYYNADIDNTFDARVSVDGRIEIGGMPFRIGKFLLQKVSMKKGMPSNYTINFLGNLGSLKDSLGDDKLADLDLSAYDHPYDSDSVQFLLKGLTSSYPSIIYNLLVKKQYYYNSNASDDVMTDTLANIHYKAGTDNGVLWNDLRPSIALYQIINAIETDYGFTFSSDFFGLDVFKKLYLWLNNTTDEGAGGDSQVVDWDTGSSDYINLTTNIGLFDVSNTSASLDNFYWLLYFDLIPAAGYEDVNYTILTYVDGEVGSEVSTSGNGSVTDKLIEKDAPSNPHTYSVYYEISSDQEFKYTAKVMQRNKRSGLQINEVTTYASENTIGSNFVVTDNIPDMKIIDFLKGIFNAFKLVVIPQDDGTLYVDTVDNYYAAGQTLDLTEWIDAESMDVSRGDILNTINYNFEDPQTILNVTFESNNSIAYGDEEAQLRDDLGVLLDGSTLEIQLPFEQVIYERLNDINGNETINLMYGAIIDESLSPANPKAHVFYNQTKSVNGSGIGFINDDGSKDKIRGLINTASHCIDDENPTNSFIFSAEFNNFSGDILKNNLYSNYHQDYIDSLFNIKRRSFTFNTKILPVSILLDLTLNDVVKIGYNYYRIDKFTTDLTTGKTELNLINLV